MNTIYAEEIKKMYFYQGKR